MKTRTRRIPPAGEDNFLPEKVLAAEQKFAASMHREVKTSPRRVAVPPRPQATRQSGQDMGQGFARVALMSDRTRSFVNAIHEGARADRQRAAETRELAQDSDYLRSLGFAGRGEDDEV